MEFNPRRLSEANIQAECYHRLRGMGVESYLEYRYDNCRFDMVILDLKRERVLAIVEFKNYPEIRLVNERTRQFRKYHSLGVPVIYCVHMDALEGALKEIERVVSEDEEDCKITVDKLALGDK